jgi:hypothetical protein
MYCSYDEIVCSNEINVIFAFLSLSRPIWLSTVYVYIVYYISRTASLIYDNISEMLKISQLPPLYFYTL